MHERNPIVWGLWPLHTTQFYCGQFCNHFHFTVFTWVVNDPGCNDDKLRTPYDSLEYDKNYSVTIPEQPLFLIIKFETSAACLSVSLTFLCHNIAYCKLWSWLCYDLLGWLGNWNSCLCFVQVDENGKITRLRRECPNEECGAGVFMASHFDRHYCGKCCLTYVFNKPEEKAWALVSIKLIVAYIVFLWQKGMGVCCAESKGICSFLITVYHTVDLEWHTYLVLPSNCLGFNRLWTKVAHKICPTEKLFASVGITGF